MLLLCITKVPTETKYSGIKLNEALSRYEVLLPHFDNMFDNSEWWKKIKNPVVRLHVDSAIKHATTLVPHVCESDV